METANHAIIDAGAVWTPLSIVSPALGSTSSRQEVGCVKPAQRDALSARIVQVASCATMGFT